MRPDLVRDLIQLTTEHLVLVASAMLVAILVGVPLGILPTRHPAIRRWLLGFASVVQTIPSLALFGFLIPIPLIGGIGKRTVIVSLVLYALLPILRNTFVGIMSVAFMALSLARLAHTLPRNCRWRLSYSAELPDGSLMGLPKPEFRCARLPASCPRHTPPVWPEAEYQNAAAHALPGKTLPAANRSLACVSHAPPSYTKR